MGEGRSRAQWDHTSVLVAAAFNANPFRSGKPVSPDQFHPYRSKAKKNDADGVVILPASMVASAFISAVCAAPGNASPRNPSAVSIAQALPR